LLLVVLLVTGLDVVLILLLLVMLLIGLDDEDVLSVGLEDTLFYVMLLKDWDCYPDRATEPELLAELPEEE